MKVSLVTEGFYKSTAIAKRSGGCVALAAGRAGEQNRSPCTGGSEVLDPHGLFRPFVKCLPLTFKLNEAVIFAQHCFDPLPRHCWCGFRPENWSNWKVTLREERRRWKRMISVMSAIYQGCWTLMSKKMKLLYRAGNKPIILGKRPWGKYFSWCWCSLRSV